MISFADFLPEPNSPIYLQIIRHVKRGVVAGTVGDGDELPSRRVLSSLLGVNPNTVQKAYRLLEEEGLIQSHSGAKSCVVLSEERLAAVRAELLEADARQAVRTLRQLGITREEAIGLLNEYWDGGDGE